MKLKGNGIIFGLLVIGAGILLILFNMGVLPVVYKPIVFSWQMLLIGLGFVGLFSREKFFPGLLLILLGGFLLLPKLGIEELSSLRGNGWAVLLILTGCFIIGNLIFGRRWHCRNIEHKAKHLERKAQAYHDYFTCKTRNNETGYIERNYVFGGSKEKWDTPDFRGGEINCVFGGFELDLSNAHLAEGINTLEVSTVFGGVTLYLPAHWRVEVRETQIFGRFVDKREQPNFEVSENKVLIIKASSVFGGGEIKSGK